MDSVHDAGTFAFQQDDDTTALKLRPLAENRHVKGRHLLTLMYAKGPGVAKTKS